jgi:putative DNA primase/helicase
VAVLDATAEYRTEQDVLAEFLDICTERATGSVVKAQEMHSAYAGWAEENGEKVNSARWLGFRLRDRGFANMRDRGGYHWQNVRLSEEGERLREAHQIKRGIM